MANVTQAEYNVAKQCGRIIHTKINILNFDFQIVDEISGVVLDGSTYSIDATSDIRRTCSISLIPKNSTFDIQYGGKLWMDKYVQIFIGIEDVTKNNEIIYSNLGLYLINNPEQIYDATNNTITINGIDLMAKMTGLRNGYLEGITYQVPVNSNIKGVMTKLINQESGFTKYSIDQPSPTILTPNEMSFGLGSSAYNILSQLRDINSNYQTYFDVDGIFWFNQIPSGENEQIMVNDDIWNKVLINYKKSSDFENVKNYIEVFGKTQDDGNTPYGLAFDDNPQSPFYIGEPDEDGKYPNQIRIVLSGGEYDNIFPLGEYYKYTKVQLVSSDQRNPQEEGWYVLDGSVYVASDDVSITYNPVTTDQNDNPFEKGYYELVNGSYILSTDTQIVKRKVYYLPIDYYIRSVKDIEQFNSLAQQRANYELYVRCRLQDQIELTCVPVYWLDVNWLIEITLPNKQSQPTKELYIIKKINTTLGVSGTQSITLMKYYPLYPS